MLVRVRSITALSWLSWKGFIGFPPVITSLSDCCSWWWTLLSFNLSRSWDRNFFLSWSVSLLINISVETSLVTPRYLVSGGYLMGSVWSLQVPIQSCCWLPAFVYPISDELFWALVALVHFLLPVCLSKDRTTSSLSDIHDAMKLISGVCRLCSYCDTCI